MTVATILSDNASLSEGKRIYLGVLTRYSAPPTSQQEISQNKKRLGKC